MRKSELLIIFFHTHNVEWPPEPRALRRVSPTNHTAPLQSVTPNHTAPSQSVPPNHGPFAEWPHETRALRRLAPRTTGHIRIVSDPLDKKTNFSEVSFFFFYFLKNIVCMSITNLPDSIAGSAFPFDAVVSRLQRGMALEVHYNGTIVRRGIVLLPPSESRHFMWWELGKRMNKHEDPQAMCQTLIQNIPEERLEYLTIVPIHNFSWFFSQLPLVVKVLLGHPKQGPRGQRELRDEAQERRRLLAAENESKEQECRWRPQSFEVHSPPCDIPDFVVLTENVSGGEGPSGGDQEVVVEKKRKVRKDKGVRRGPKRERETLPPAS